MDEFEHPDMLELFRIGARLALKEHSEEWQRRTAEAMGLTLEPGEDFLAALARSKGASRDHLQQYFQALASGASVEEAHILAWPSSGPAN